MRKGKQTRQDILHKVAVLFNEKGYAATSMQDITAVTGIQRGGIYNHFASKEKLALETFDYACLLMKARIMQAITLQTTALGCLKAIANSFAELYTQNPIFPCGCQILNTAVEAKRQLPKLRQKAQEAMNQLNDLIIEKAHQGIEWKEFPNSINPDAMAAIFIATLEGAMLLSVLYDDTAYLNHAVGHLHWYLDNLSAKGDARVLSST